jgi:hypothetical protein
MPMLHGCAVTGCGTLTLSTYCFEHEMSVRAEIESERAKHVGRGEPPAELADAPRAAA